MADKAWIKFVEMLRKENTEVLHESAIRQFAITEVLVFGEHSARVLCDNVKWNAQEVIDAINGPDAIDFTYLASGNPDDPANSESELAKLKELVNKLHGNQQVSEAT